jgi:ABC-2 type transport system ATP-binding protein
MNRMADQDGLIVRDLNKTYHKFSLKNISLEIPRGMVYGLIGRNGAGKTTLLKCLFDAVTSDSGEVLFSNTLYTGKEREIKGKIGFLHEDDAFFDDMTPGALENMIKRFYPLWDRAAYLSTLELFRISLNVKLKKLSKGQKRLVSLSLLLARSPELLILDEPLSGLDPLARDLIVNLLRELVAQKQTTILLSSHITDCMEDFIDYAGFLVKGRLIFSRPWIELKDEYRRLIGPVAIGQQFREKELYKKIYCIQRGDINYTALIPRDLSLPSGEEIRLEMPGLNDILALAEEEEYHATYLN